MTWHAACAEAARQGCSSRGSEGAFRGKAEDVAAQDSRGALRDGAPPHHAAESFLPRTPLQTKTQGSCSSSSTARASRGSRLSPSPLGGASLSAGTWERRARSAGSLKTPSVSTPSAAGLRLSEQESAAAHSLGVAPLPLSPHLLGKEVWLSTDALGDAEIRGIFNGQGKTKVQARTGASRKRDSMPPFLPGIICGVQTPEVPLGMAAVVVRLPSTKQSTLHSDEGHESLDDEGTWLERRAVVVRL